MLESQKSSKSLKKQKQVRTMQLASKNCKDNDTNVNVIVPTTTSLMDNNAIKVVPSRTSQDKIMSEVSTTPLQCDRKVMAIRIDAKSTETTPITNTCYLRCARQENIDSNDDDDDSTDWQTTPVLLTDQEIDGFKQRFGAVVVQHEAPINTVTEMIEFHKSLHDKAIPFLMKTDLSREQWLTLIDNHDDDVSLRDIRWTESGMWFIE